MKNGLIKGKKLPKSNTQKQADHRLRLGAGGLFKRRDFWVHPDDEQLLRKLEKRLRNRRLRTAAKASTEDTT